MLREPLELVARMFAADDRLRGLPRHVVLTMVLDEDAVAVVAHVLTLDPILALRALTLNLLVGVLRAY